MANERTVNAFVPNRGDIQVTVSTATAAAIAGLTTAETFSMKGVLRKFERSNNPSRPEEAQRVAGHPKPINFVGGIEESENWRIVILDDKSKGAAGEWGTDLVTAYDFFLWHFTTETPIAGLSCTPAGETTGMIQYVLDNDIIVKSVGTPVIDADAKTADEIEIIVSCPGHTPAARA